MRTFLITAFIFFTGTHVFAQKDEIIWDVRQPLQWTDFAGQAKDTSRFDAESFAEVKYNYTFNNPRDFYFDVFANFNKNASWCRNGFHSEALLKHEQLHFDIAALYAKKLKEAFDSYRYTDDYKNEILQIFEQKKQEYHLMQNRYDDETNHSVNRERQNAWEKFIQDQLNVAKPRYDYAQNKKD